MPVKGEYLMPTYAPAPVTFVSGEGCRLFDDQGKEYLDFLCGIAVTTLGHAHPKVTEAICRQAGTLSHVSNLFSNAVGPELAATIDRLITAAIERIGGGASAGRVFFGNSGAEANECALKLARRRGGPDRRTIVSVEGGFHGRTFGALAATAQPEKQAAFTPLPGGFIQVPFGDPDAFDALDDPDQVAAVIVETIQGERGVRPLPAPILAAARHFCDEHGALLIMDEIQTGLGRTGRWFGFEHSRVVPDVVTLAKALGNGMPIGACWARGEVAGAFSPGDHGSTFGGQPLAGSAALATLGTIEKEGLVARAAEAGESLAGKLSGLPSVTEVRGAGLLIGLGLAEGVDPKAVARAALERGLVVNAIAPSTLRLAPPLIISDSDISRGVDILADALLGGVR